MGLEVAYFNDRVVRTKQDVDLFVSKGASQVQLLSPFFTQGPYGLKNFII
jgi:hypothetical protein